MTSPVRSCPRRPPPVSSVPPVQGQGQRPLVVLLANVKTCCDCTLKVDATHPNLAEACAMPYGTTADRHPLRCGGNGVTMNAPARAGAPMRERGATVRIEPLYRVRFTYPEAWGIDLEGGWEQYLFLAEGRCEGSVCGRFRGANFPRRRTSAGPFCPDLRAVIETDDGATIMVECQGYGRAYPPGARQIVASMLHLSDDDRYRRLNDVVCVCVGEVRAPDDPDGDPDLVMDVAELIWEPLAP